MSTSRPLTVKALRNLKRHAPTLDTTKVRAARLIKGALKVYWSTYDFEYWFEGRHIRHLDQWIIELPNTEPGPVLRKNFDTLGQAVSYLKRHPLLTDAITLVLTDPGMPPKDVTIEGDVLEYLRKNITRSYTCAYVRGDRKQVWSCTINGDPWDEGRVGQRVCALVRERGVTEGLPYVDYMTLELEGLNIEGMVDYVIQRVEQDAS